MQTRRGSTSYCVACLIGLKSPLPILAVVCADGRRLEHLR